MNQQNQCGIARDLMPLSIDGVCSETSQRFLDEHVSQCPPCQSLYIRMKNVSLPEVKADPIQEAQALKQGLRWLGRRFRALWIALASLACAFLLLLAAAGVNQIVWNWRSDVPLELYSMRISSTSALANILVSGDFSQQTYIGYQLDTKFIGDTAGNHTGQPKAVILTYTLQYYPNQAKNYATHAPVDTVSLPFVSADQLAAGDIPQVKLGNSFVASVSDFELCRDGNKIYLIDGMEGITTSDGDHLMLLDTGLPVSEIRIKAGKYVEVIYTWGDGFDIYPEALTENGLPASKIMLRKDYEAMQSPQ